MGGSTSSNITQIYPVMPRTVFYGGNTCVGNLIIQCKDEVEYSCISVRLVGELRQSYLERQTEHYYSTAFASNNNNNFARREVVTPIADVGCTLIGNMTGKGSYRLSKGAHNFEWAFVLPPQLLPSVSLGSAQHDSSTVQIMYYITAQVMVGGKSAKQGSIPIHILFPIAESMWARPSGISKPFALDLTACLCCSHGTITGFAGMGKTIFALDRDSLAYSVQIDATKSEDPVENVTVSLIATCNVKGGNFPTRLQAVIFAQKIRCNIKAGTTGVANGVLQLGANRPPTIQSNILDINYKCRFSFDFDYAASTQCEVDIFVAHSVDSTNMMNAQSLHHQQVQTEVPNLLNPLYQQFLPPGLAQNLQMMMHPQQQQPQAAWGGPQPQPQSQPQFAPLPPQYQQQPDQYNAHNFDQSQQQYYAQYQQQQNQQFGGGIAAFPSQQLSLQAQIVQ